MAATPNQAEQNNNEIPTWARFSGKLGIGSLVGYMAGNFLKQVSDEMILYSGMAGLLIGGLHYMRWITINWRQIDSDLLQVVEKVKHAGQEGFF